MAGDDGGAGSDTEAADWAILRSAGNRESTFVGRDKYPRETRGTDQFADRQEALHRQGAVRFDEDGAGLGRLVLRQGLELGAEPIAVDDAAGHDEDPGTTRRDQAMSPTFVLGVVRLRVVAASRSSKPTYMPGA